MVSDISMGIYGIIVIHTFSGAWPAEYQIVPYQSTFVAFCRNIVMGPHKRTAKVSYSFQQMDLLDKQKKLAYRDQHLYRKQNCYRR